MMRTLLPGQFPYLSVLDAHCDDAVIGADGTLLTLRLANSGCEGKGMTSCGCC